MRRAGRGELARWVARQEQKRMTMPTPEAHTLVVEPVRRPEDVLVYTTSAGEPRLVILDHSRVSEGR